MASVGPCTLSFGTTRKKLVHPSVLSFGFVADGLTVATWAPENVGSAAAVAPEKAGPTTATILLLVTMAWAAVGDCAAVPWSSSSVYLSVNGSEPKVLPALAWLIASSTANFMLRPSCALPPESGPS